MDVVAWTHHHIKYHAKDLQALMIALAHGFYKGAKWRSYGRISLRIEAGDRGSDHLGDMTGCVASSQITHSFTVARSAQSVGGTSLLGLKVSTVSSSGIAPTEELSLINMVELADSSSLSVTLIS